MALPLEGIKVIDLAQVWAVPGAGMYLADQGAGVIKVEPLWGDGARRLTSTPFLGEDAPGFLAMNRNKRGIAVDLSLEPGREIAHRLLRDADVALVNFRPGTAKRLGLDYERLQALNPRLVYLAVTPYGERGEWAHRRGYDNLFRALSGQIGREAAADGTPGSGGTWTVDTAGAMGLAFAVMLALFHRERTGRGQRVDTSMLSIAVALQAVGLVKAYDDTSAGKRLALAPGTFRCADGSWVAITIVSEKDWTALCRLLELEHLAGPEAYQAIRADAEMRRDAAETMAGIFETKPRGEWLRLLLATDLALAPILKPDEAMEHPQLVENGLFTEVEHAAAGRVKLFAPPFRVAGALPSVRSAAPVLGQHTDEVLSELGYTPDAIAELRAQKVIR